MLYALGFWFLVDNEIDEIWYFLPILGPSLKNKNIIYAFGHQHLGWTLGAITGKIISKIVAGEKTNLDLTPYSSKRFN